MVKARLQKPKDAKKDANLSPRELREMIDCTLVGSEAWIRRNGYVSSKKGPSSAHKSQTKLEIASKPDGTN